MGFSTSMAASAEELSKNDYLHIPLIDLRSFCQDELNVAARLSGYFPESQFNDMVSPKIDKTIFNESTGSRRQTYSRSTVAPRLEGPTLDSHAKKSFQGNSTGSLSDFLGSVRRNKKYRKNILDLVDKILYTMDRENENQPNVSSSLSLRMPEEIGVLNLPPFEGHRQDDRNKDVPMASLNMPGAIHTPEAFTKDSEMEGGIHKIRESLEKSAVLHVANANAKNLETVELKRGFPRSDEDKLGTQHSLQLVFPERLQLYEQMGSLEYADMPAETSGQEIKSMVCEKQRQSDTFFVELRQDILDADRDKVTVVDGLNRLKQQSGRPRSMETKGRRPPSVVEKELHSDTMIEVGDEFFSDSTKRVGEGSPCSASKDVGREFYIIVNKAGGGSQFHHNDIKLESRRDFFSNAFIHEGKEVSSDASVVDAIAAKQVGYSNNEGTTEKLRAEVRERAKAAAVPFYTKQCYGLNLKKKRPGKRLNECDISGQILCRKKHKFIPAHGFIESSRNKLPNDWGVEAGLQRRESGECDYYQKCISPDGVQYTELKEASNCEPPICGEVNNAEGTSGTSETEIRNMSSAGYHDSNHRSYTSFEVPFNEAQVQNFCVKWAKSSNEERPHSLSSNCPCTGITLENGIDTVSISLDKDKTEQVQIGNSGVKTTEKFISAQGEIYNLCNVQNVLLKDKDVHNISQLQDSIQCLSVEDRQIIKPVVTDASVGITFCKDSSTTEHLHQGREKAPIGQLLYSKTRGKTQHGASAHGKCFSNVEVIWKNCIRFYRCQTCLKSFDTMKKCVGHLSIHYRRLKTRQAPLPNIRMLKKYMDRGESGDSYKCKECGKVFERYGSFRGHLGVHGRMFKKHLRLTVAQPVDKTEVKEQHNVEESEVKDRNEEMNSSNNMDSPESISIPWDPDEPNVETSVYVCKQCGKTLNKYRCYLGHIAAHVRWSRKKRGRPRLRDKVQNIQIPDKKVGQPRLQDKILYTDEPKRNIGQLRLQKENQDETIIAWNNIQSEGVKALVDPDKPKRKVGRPRLKCRDQHKEVHCDAVIQSSVHKAFVDQAGLKTKVGRPRKKMRVKDIDFSNDIKQTNASILVYPVEPKKKVGWPRKIQMNCGNRNQSVGILAPVNQDVQNKWIGQSTSKTNTDGSPGGSEFADQARPERKIGQQRLNDKIQIKETDCSNGIQFSGATILVNSAESKRRVGRPRKIQFPIYGNSHQEGKMNCSNGNHNEERNCNRNNEERNCNDSNLDEEMNFHNGNQSVVAMASVDPHGQNKSDGDPRSGKKTKGEEMKHDSSIQSVGAVTPSIEDSFPGKDMDCGNSNPSVDGISLVD